MLISIPVTEEVYAFCRQEFGGHPIVISSHNRHPVPRRIAELFSVPDHYRLSRSSNSYTHKLSCQLPDDYVKHNRIHLDQESVEKINSFVHDYIRQRLFDMLDILLAVKDVNIGLTIQQYLTQYQLHDCISYETLKKAYYRHRQRPAIRHVPYIAAMC
jgi:hypothetical protein